VPSHEDGPDVSSALIVDEHWQGTTAVLSCTGVIDMLTSRQLDAAMTAAESKEPFAIIVDLTAVEFLASTGIGLLVFASDSMTPKGRFAVVADGPATSRPLTVIGVAEHINMQPTLDAAFASIIRAGTA
jgi:anti-sigma B factor antagonist